MRFAVLVSGAGTNLAALLRAQESGLLGPAEIVLVVSNRPGARAIDRAKAASVKAMVVDHTSFSSREDFESEMLATLAAEDIEAVVLAGFMRVLTPTFISAYADRIINTHPALCPAFPGIRAPQQAIDHGVRVSGCTVHFVDTGVDTGPIIAQEVVEVLPDDDAGSLHERIKEKEHQLLPMATRLLAEGRLRVCGRRVRIDQEPRGAD